MDKHEILEVISWAIGVLDGYDPPLDEAARERFDSGLARARKVLSANTWGPGGGCPNCGRLWNIRNSRACPDCP